MRCAIFFFQAEDGIRDSSVTGVQTCALPICGGPPRGALRRLLPRGGLVGNGLQDRRRSEEHTSELQSHLNLVCRLRLEKRSQSLFVYTVLNTSLKAISTGFLSQSG